MWYEIFIVFFFNSAHKNILKIAGILKQVFSSEACFIIVIGVVILWLLLNILQIFINPT